MEHNINTQIDSNYQDIDYLIEMESQYFHFQAMEICRDEKRKYRLKYPNHSDSEIIRLSRRNIHKRMQKIHGRLASLRMQKLGEMTNGM